MLIYELLPIGPVGSVFELSESIRGSTFLAASDDWGPLVVELDVSVMLLDVESTAGPGMIFSCALSKCNKHVRPTTSRGCRSYVGSDTVRRGDAAGGVVGSSSSAVRSEAASNGVGTLRGGQHKVIECVNKKHTSGRSGSAIGSSILNARQ